MIQTEMIGENLIRHYSDSNYRIRQIETGDVYDDAVDTYPCPYTYEETHEPMTQETVEVINNFGKSIMGMFAPVEDAPVATRNYYPNNMLTLNDTVYKVTNPIAMGSQIVDDYNVTQTTIGAEISELINNSED